MLPSSDSLRPPRPRAQVFHARPCRGQYRPPGSAALRTGQNRPDSMQGLRRQDVQQGDRMATAGNGQGPPRRPLGRLGEIRGYEDAVDPDHGQSSADASSSATRAAACSAALV